MSDTAWQARLCSLKHASPPAGRCVWLLYETNDSTQRFCWGISPTICIVYMNSQSYNYADMDTMQTLDKLDIKILKTLAQDGRMSWRELSEQIGLSLTPTLRRVRQLEESGIIKGYAAKLDQDRLLGPMPVFINVTLERQIDEVMTSFETLVSTMPEIMGGYLMSGGSDYLLHAFVRDLDHYRVLLSQLTRIQGIVNIQSSFVLKAFTHRTTPLINTKDVKK